jgi:HEAT repeat protein
MFAEIKSRTAFVLVGVAALIACTSSCASSSSGNWTRKLAFWNKEDVDPRGALAPYKVVDKLREDRETLPTLPADQQQAKAAELATQYQIESDPLVRAQIVRTISVCGAPPAGATLTAALQDADRDVRLAACEAWGVHGGPQAVPSLSNLLRHDRSMDVRLAAARALGQLKGPEVVQALAPGLEDPDPAMQYRIVQSLRESTGKDFGDNVNAWNEFVRGGSPPEISASERLKLKYF